MWAVNKRKSMTDRQFTLEHRLLLLRDEIKTLQSEKTLSSKELSTRLKTLLAERSKLEDELINLVVNPENSYRAEALDGLKEGLLATVQSLEEALRGANLTKDLSRPLEAEHKVGFVTRLFTSLTKRPALAWISAALFVYLLLVAVSALGDGFNALFGGANAAKELFAFATNPFMGLLVGLLATAIIQSSSTTTSILVALCAAGLPIATAIPMVMGANIGTSVTNTLVSLGHMGHRREFRRAFAAATIHDFFNIFAVLILLPLEMMFGLLAKASASLTSIFYGAGGVDMKSVNFVGAITKPVVMAIQSGFQSLPGPQWVGNGLFVVFGLTLIFFSILLLGKLLRMLLTGRAEKIFHAAIGKNAISAIGSGMFITMIVQSSSTTTSLAVPLAGAGLMKLKQIFPFTLGANIGTCITAILAATAITGSGADLALQIALIHMLFNVIGVFMIYGIPVLRRIPLVCASSLAKLACECRVLAIIYIVITFFILPLIGIGIYKLFE
jgi:sodium-dependent phosphate cotransporter